MTTIAWDGVTLATDSRVTYGPIIVNDDMKKIIRNVGPFDAVAVAGVPKEAEALINFFSEMSFQDFLEVPEKQVESLIPETSLIGVYQGKVWTLLGSGTYAWKWSFSWGSGREFALSAMDYGATAVDAVKYAMTRDIYSGGKIRKVQVVK